MHRYKHEDFTINHISTTTNKVTVAGRQAGMRRLYVPHLKPAAKVNKREPDRFLLILFSLLVSHIQITRCYIRWKTSQDAGKATPPKKLLS